MKLGNECSSIVGVCARVSSCLLTLNKRTTCKHASIIQKMSQIAIRLAKRQDLTRSNITRTATTLLTFTIDQMKLYYRAMTGRLAPSSSTVPAVHR